jgi:hypothetical protein
MFHCEVEASLTASDAPAQGLTFLTKRCLTSKELPSASYEVRPMKRKLSQDQGISSRLRRSKRLIKRGRH